MVPSRVLLILVASAGFIGGSRKTGLSFSPLPLFVTNQCQRSPPHYHDQQALATTAVLPLSTKHGETRYSNCASVGLHALPSPLSGLPSLDGLPGVGGSAVSSPDNNGVTTTTTAAAVQRSRRGKYPVIELWRQETGDFLDNERGSADEDNTEEFGGREKSTSAPRDAQTALGYLRAVLGLGVDQTDAMLEAFPALAEVSPDKLDVRAKLVRQLIDYNIYRY